MPAMRAPMPRATAPISGCALPLLSSRESRAWRAIGLCMMRCNFSSHRAFTPSPSRRFEALCFPPLRAAKVPSPHMKKQLLQAAAAVALLAALPAFAQNAAIVNGKPVPKARMDVLAQQLAAAGRPVTPEMQGQLREEVVAREIFMQEAQKQGLDATDDYKNQLEL